MVVRNKFRNLNILKVLTSRWCGGVWWGGGECTLLGVFDRILKKVRLRETFLEIKERSLNFLKIVYQQRF